jgi:hypothetical protein
MPNKKENLIKKFIKNIKFFKTFLKYSKSINKNI